MAEAPRWPVVAESIAASIRSGQYDVGGRLPRAGDLAREYGVAEGTARKAIARLADRGWLRVRPNVGIFVQAVPPDPLPDLDDDRDPLRDLEIAIADLSRRVQDLEDRADRREK